MLGPDGNFDPSKKPSLQIPAELARQYAASESTGIPVEWRVANPDVADAIEAMVINLGYDDRITVTTVPPA